MRCHFARACRSSLKPQKPKDYSETPDTLGQHLKKRRREHGLLQQEAGERMGVSAETVANWEKNRTKPVPSQFKPVVAFLGYDPMSPAATLAERFEAKRRSLGATLDQVAQYLGWDEGSLRRYLWGKWRLSPHRSGILEQFLNQKRKGGSGGVGYASPEAIEARCRGLPARQNPGNVQP